MNELALQDDTRRMADVRIALKNSLYPGAKDESVDMVLAYCAAARLDPMTKPVHIVPMSVKVGKSQYEWRDVVMPGIELYRTKAHDTGEYAGQDEAEFGPTVEGKWGDIVVRYPEWAKVTVYRNVGGARVPFVGKAFWTETYSTAGRDTTAPNAMWRKRPFGQIEKCAEALALRKAFPEAIGAHQTYEEMDGKLLGSDELPARQDGDMPRSKSAAKAAAPAADVIEGEFTEERATEQSAPEQSARREPAKQASSVEGAGSNPLSDGMRRVLQTKLDAAGITMDQLTAGFGDVAAANINKAFAWISEQKKG